ncbi:uncharacterized protein DUF1446 [Tamaricihabitans halophyticus]|uniref:Uncharacterized protein DUF1446 n=1 Tax=Tamaricihabitans halophyticus TaxID=1262583 RepID=A0A4R2QV40_9PSEU|nr:acyclic terpene utilization AtuA family protein [Tamaricihabitans halophyticus]TCP53597.1 uncharacterized protein DUF1446 [Tamaricihabitans halophyticus]
MRHRPIRIANFSGYFGDRFTAIDEVLAGDPVDVLVGDYLAEITLAALSARYLRDPSTGYVEYFLDQLKPHLASIAERGIKLVTNAGGFHPEALAEAVRTLADEASAPLRVAYVAGDNLLDQLPALAAAGHELPNLDTGAPLASWDAKPIAANAYLGGWGIAAALEAGADIVVCGRVTDASLTVGPAAWWHGWQRTDWDALAGAVAAGHIIECGAHATGGNFSGFTEIPAMTTPGFPIAEIAADGSSVITKHARDDGAVTVDTVTAQLVYEIQGPYYRNPDVTVRLDSLELTQLAPDRVQLTGTTGTAPPETTKVALFAPIGYHVVHTVYVTAPNVPEKIELLRTQLTSMLPDGVDELSVTGLGTAAADPAAQWEATVPVRIMAVAREREPLARLHLASKAGSLYLSSIPGFYTDVATSASTQPRPRIEYWPALLPLTEVPHRVGLPDGDTVDIAAPPTAEVLSQPHHPEPTEEPRSTGPVHRLPLGTLAHARSGDKGGNSNVGVWVSDPQAWPWLRELLSTAELRRLLPECKDLTIERHEFPRLRAVHFVLRGLLGQGGSSNNRVDQIGKAIGEYLRAKHVLIPEELLSGRERDHGTD